MRAYIFKSMSTSRSDSYLRVPIVALVLAALGALLCERVNAGVLPPAPTNVQTFNRNNIEFSTIGSGRWHHLRV